MKTTKAIVKDYQVIEPSMYYAYPMETIYRVWEGNSKHFLHTYSNGEVVFCSRHLGCMLPNIEIFGAKEDGEFSEYFNEMSEVDSYDDICIKEYLNIIFANSVEQPIIIGGCGRSGTTLLLSILDAHPSLMSIHKEMYSFYPKPFRLRQLSREVEKSCGRRWVEKTPKNIHAFRDIYNMLDGKVKLIHIVRDGRDVVTSIHPGHKHRFWVDKERWVSDVTAGLKNQDICYLLKYEDLALNPEETLRKLCEYLELDYTCSLLNFSKFSGKRYDISLDGEIKELYTKSIGRWKNKLYENRVRDFMCDSLANNLMVRLGYGTS